MKMKILLLPILIVCLFVNGYGDEEDASSSIRLSNSNFSELNTPQKKIVGLYTRYLISDPEDLEFIVLEVDVFNEDEEVIATQAIELPIKQIDGKIYIEHAGGVFEVENNRVEMVIDFDPIDVDRYKEYALYGIDTKGKNTPPLKYTSLN